MLKSILQWFTWTPTGVTSWETYESIVLKNLDTEAFLQEEVQEERICSKITRVRFTGGKRTLFKKIKHGPS